MKAHLLKRTRNHVHRTQRYPLYAALGALLVALIVLTCVWVAKDGAQQKVQLSRSNLVTAIQNELNGAIRVYENVALPTADLRGEILPTMRQHLHTARMMNRVLQDTHKETVVEEQMLNQLEDAMDQVQHMLQLGQSTQSAERTLGSMLQQMETDLRERFADSGLFLSRTALK